MERVYVALGGNIGETEQIFARALQKIKSLDGVAGLLVSSFYQTKPVSEIAQADFLNAVCSFETTLNPKALLRALQKIERDLGKVKKGRDEPRVIDLDLIFYGNEVVHDEELMIPHPRWHEREFVLTPLIELMEKEQHVQSIA